MLNALLCKFDICCLYEWEFDTSVVILVFGMSTKDFFVNIDHDVIIDNNGGKSMDIFFGGDFFFSFR